ncbi:MAG: thiamine pyrophosphate-dependent dehydrogenase E1 component subunit alpha [Gemmatimonadota bacterium]|nr:MAG: thiamine pyrophosphate-dependent dehydrogenase E1 component subunit alpha [Gemmatimonadota bacterium]
MPATDSADGTALVAGLTKTQLHELYFVLVRVRATEERLELLHTQGQISGGVYRSLGQEAGSVGAGYALNRRADGTGDIIAPTVRAFGALFLMGGEPLDLFRQYLARGTGPTGGKDADVHWVDYQRGLVGPISPLGTMVGVMAGITLSFRLKGEPRVGLVFCGDEVTSTGAWHEGLNFAAAQRCPMVLMVEANQWASSTQTRKNTRLESFTQKAAGYGLHAESVDGTDVLEVCEGTKRAVDRARGGEGAGMVEMRYYRRKGHVQHDNQEYVDPAELKAWEERDPIKRFGERLLSEGWATQDALEALSARAEDEVRMAADQAADEPTPEGVHALDAVYTDRGAKTPWTRLETPDPIQA